MTLRGPARSWGAGQWYAPLVQHAREAPNRIALVADDGTWTFRVLDEAAERLAGLLAGRGVRRGDTVACVMERTGRAVLAILALARLGAVYLPLDARAPGSRLAGILRDAEPAAVLSDLTEPPDVAVGGWEWLAGPSEEGDFARCLMARGPGADREASARAGLGDTPAYIIYTSGSTGQPKGVVVGNRGLVNLYGELRENFFGRAGGRRYGYERVAHGMPLSFDASWNPLLWLVGGHELHLLDEATRADPERYVHEIRSRGLSVTEAVPSLADAMVAEGLLAADTRPDLLLMGGEAIGAALWQRLREVRGMASANLYGPTETTVFATACFLDDYPEPSIGRPIANTVAHLADQAGQPVEAGVTGELWLGGEGVALGYWRRPELTAARFVVDRAERWYRTGDLCRQLPDGRLQFQGRLDDQVKIRGQRVEPGEAEHALLACPEVRQAAVTTLGDDSSRRLVAYVVTDGDPASIGAVLRERLPGYLLPAMIIPVRHLPLTPNGKVDRSALATAPERIEGRPLPTPPGTPAEQVIAGQWRDVLGSTVIDIHEDFFDAGGHSLRAAQLATRLRASGLPCELEHVLTHPTIAKLAVLLTEAGRPSPRRTEASADEHL